MFSCICKFSDLELLLSAVENQVKHWEKLSHWNSSAAEKKSEIIENSFA